MQKIRACFVASLSSFQRIRKVIQNYDFWALIKRQVQPFKLPNECLRYVSDERATYNKMVRPKLDYHDALFVNMSVTLMQILELNERRQYLASSVMYTFVSNLIILGLFCRLKKSQSVINSSAYLLQELNDVIMNHCRKVEKTCHINFKTNED